jgi:hypothetical protein
VLLLCILDALVKKSALSFYGFHSFQANDSIILLTTLFISLCSSSFTNDPTIHCCMILADEKAPLNKQRITQLSDSKAHGLLASLPLQVLLVYS